MLRAAEEGGSLLTGRCCLLEPNWQLLSHHTSVDEFGGLKSWLAISVSYCCITKYLTAFIKQHTFIIVHEFTGQVGGSSHLGQAYQAWLVSAGHTHTSVVNWLVWDGFSWRNWPNWGLFECISHISPAGCSHSSTRTLRGMDGGGRREERERREKKASWSLSLKWAHCPFCYVVLVKTTHKANPVWGVRKQTPLLDGGSCQSHCRGIGTERSPGWGLFL